MEFTHQQIREMKELLIKYGLCICFGKTCEGKIKCVSEFIKSMLYCKQCNRFNGNESKKKCGLASRRIRNSLKIDEKCETCGCDDPNLLEFDHLENKEFNISECTSVDKILEEAKKTRLLCIWCHRLHSKKQTEENTKMTKDDYKYSEEEENEVIDEENCKTCNGLMCNGKLRNSNKFYLSKNKLGSYCKKCLGYDSMIRRRLSAMKIDNVKLEIGKCNDCNKPVTKDTLCCFDFDHIICKGKKMDISKMRNKPTLDNEFIEDELKKCQLLCCICHYKKTMKQFNYIEITAENSQNIMYNVSKRTEIAYCKSCNKQISHGCNFCQNCSSINKRKVERPSYEQLKKDLDEMTCVATAKKYGVSDKAIKKWIKNYEKENLIENI